MSWKYKRNTKTQNIWLPGLKGNCCWQHGTAQAEPEEPPSSSLLHLPYDMTQQRLSARPSSHTPLPLLPPCSGPLKQSIYLCALPGYSLSTISIFCCLLWSDMNSHSCWLKSLIFGKHVESISFTMKKVNKTGLVHHFFFFLKHQGYR